MHKKLNIEEQLKDSINQMKTEEFTANENKRIYNFHESRLWIKWKRKNFNISWKQKHLRNRLTSTKYIIKWKRKNFNF